MAVVNKMTDNKCPRVWRDRDSWCAVGGGGPWCSAVVDGTKFPQNLKIELPHTRVVMSLNTTGRELDCDTFHLVLNVLATNQQHVDGFRPDRG